MSVRVQVPGGAPCGSEGNWHTSRAQISRLARSTRAFRTRWPLGEYGRPAGPWTRSSWFEARMASFAAAHGCGPALVRRVTRVGTGWRLHVLVAQQAEAPGRGPGGCGFKSRLAHRAPGSKDRTDLVSPLAEGGTRRGLHWPVALLAGALRPWTVRGSWFDSSPASSRLRSSSG